MRLFTRSFLIIAFSTAAFAQDQMANLTGETARVFATTRGQTLTGTHPSARAAVDTFLRGQGRSAAALASLQLRSESRDAAGLTQLKLSQSFDGLPVYGAYVKASVNSSGELVHLIDQLVEPRGQAARSTITADGAMAAAASRRFPGERLSFRLVSDSNGTARFSSGNTYFHQDPTATRVLVPLEGGALQTGWLVETWTTQANQLWHTVIGNGGRVLQEGLRTANESYRVFPEHPVVTLGGVTVGSPEVTLAGPGSSTASPNGWVSADGRTAGVQSQFRLAGNNTYTYLDRDANNAPDAAGVTMTDGNFTAAANLTLAPTTAPNQQVAIQNLFYSVNFVHDKLYTAGFNEFEGNFQENNFGRGGFALDSVSAEAQDGSGTNNANFSTPADGSRPRMQMYLWNLTSPNRDGDVDSASSSTNTATVSPGA